MKSGLLAGLYGLAALRGLAGVGVEEAADATAWLPFARLVFVANPDEEIGSPDVSPVIRELAARGDACSCSSAPAPTATSSSARKGTVDLRITVTGRAAHAGVEPEKGRSAILEAAHKTIALQALNGRWPGVTCNVGRDRAAGRGPTWWPSRPCWRWTCGRRPRDALEAAEAAVAGHRRAPDRARRRRATSRR